MNPRRLLRGSVMAVWAGFFLWLALSGEVVRYLGPRTYWVVWFGATVLGLAALFHALTIRSGTRGSIRPTDVGGAFLLVLPLVVVLAVPQPDLGALAASRKTTGLATLSSSAPRPAPQRGGPLDFAEIHYASESTEYATAIGATDGAKVELVGFVTHPKRAPEGTFALTRFYISCCAADAIPYSVYVVSTEDHPDDTWLKVTGRLAHLDGDLVVEPDTIAAVDKPRAPYLY
ncbi:MAG: TIGR03943 family protein [Actinomycetota bacterium]|nr:TIGR03943 family protein [Actinomycetota bacterium]